MIPKNLIFYIMLAATLIFSSSAFAGGESGQIGIGLSATEVTPTFTVSFWECDKIKLEPSFALGRLSPDEGDNYTRIIPDLGLWRYPTD